MSPAEDIKHFLIVYDVARSLAKVEEFGIDYDGALLAYTAREKEHEFHPTVEVVLLGADSIDTIKKTHSSYFVAPSEHAFSGVIRELAANN